MIDLFELLVGASILFQGWILYLILGDNYE